jgi:transposase
MTHPGRILTAKGCKPVGVKDTTRENFYLYGTVEPDTGEAFVREFPKMSTPNFQQFLNDFGQAHSVGLHLIILDGASIHWAKDLQIPDNVALIKLPPYCPELNPIEWFWRELKRPLRWKNWPSLQGLKEALCREYHKWTNERIQTLTSFPYILKTILEL